MNDMASPSSRRSLARWTAGVVALAVATAAGAAEHRGGPVRRARTTQHGSASRAAEAAAWRARHGAYFKRNWGVDIVGVRRVASGVMLRFDYRVVDPDRADVLSDHQERPFLIDEATNTALAVPAMENIGELRQIAPLETNRTYYMIFGNPGGLVKRGGRVTLVVGNLRAEGLVVD